MYYKIKLLAIVSQVCAMISVGNIMQTFTSENILETCIVDIILSKTLHGADVAIIKDNIIAEDLIRKLHESNNVKLYVKEYNMCMNISPDIYILFADDKDGFEKVIDRLDRDWHREPRALYIIALNNMTKYDLSEIFYILLDYHFIHVIVIIEDIDEDASIYSYLPYAPGMCGRDSNNTLVLGQCKKMRNFDVVERLRQSDKPDLRNCTFNALASHYPPLVLADLKPTNRFIVGIERFLVELLLEVEGISVNFTFVPETADFGEMYDNFTVTGLIKKIYENEADILFGGFSLSYRRAVLFDIICNHLAFADIFIPVLPSAGLEDRWKIVFMMFDYKVWLLLLFTMIFCSIMLTDFNNLIAIRYRSPSELLKLFGNATQNITLELRQKLFKNLIIIHWLWFMFLVSCYYQTRLTSYSTFRAYKPQIEDYMSLQKYNLTPCMTQDMAVFLKNSDIAPIINEEYLETRGCETADLSLDEVARTSSKYTVTIYYRYLWWTTKNPREISRVHVMQENIYKTHYTVFLKRGFPLLRKFENTMSHIVECGFVQAIKGLHRIPNHSRYANVVAGAFEVCLLTLNDLIIPFSILVFGHLFALVIFIIEIFHKSDKTSALH